MMFLSRVKLDLNQLHRDVLLKTLAGDAYTAHQLLWSLFSNDEERRFLFRQEFEKEQTKAGSGTHNGLPLFYVLSMSEPNSAPDWLSIETKPFKPELSAGERLGFMLRANPTVARAVDGQRSRRSDVMMHAKYAFPRAERRSPECHQAMETAALDWLTKQGKKSGFELLGETVIGAYRQHELTKTNDGARAKFSTVDYSGVLQVNDFEPFINAIAQGLGRAKAFGCGLMLIRRID